MKAKDGVEIKTEFVDKEGQIMLLKLSGFIDQSNSHLLEKTIANGLESECYKLIFDLKDLVYMSSAGWGILVGEIKRFRQFGGDLKLVSMGSDLYEVYQMLEFYHIIDEYSTLQEAVKSFGNNNKLNRMVPVNTVSPIKNDKKELRKENRKKNRKNKNKKKDSGTAKEVIETDEKDHLNLQPSQEDTSTQQDEVVEKEIELSDENLNNDGLEVNNADERIDFNPMIIERPVDFKKLPLTEKIRTIVARYPHFGIRQIKKVLHHEDFGQVKIGYFRLRKALKELELDTEEKRHRYYRSC